MRWGKLLEIGRQQAFWPNRARRQSFRGFQPMHDCSYVFISVSAVTAYRHEGNCYKIATFWIVCSYKRETVAS